MSLVEIMIAEVVQPARHHRLEFRWEMCLRLLKERKRSFAPATRTFFYKTGLDNFKQNQRTRLSSSRATYKRG
jgi:hypothetical protein